MDETATNSVDWLKFAAAECIAAVPFALSRTIQQATDYPQNLEAKARLKPCRDAECAPGRT